mmetsp:Transcript_56052/g.164595  ORF Transcript_56052/g.164595 Transcript_56052/m.164595 type:complete len:203 (+) Transcript_56052:507-1115(+)
MDISTAAVRRVSFRGGPAAVAPCSWFRPRRTAGASTRLLRRSSKATICEDLHLKQSPQSTRPHERQWQRRTVTEKSTLQELHRGARWSGTKKGGLAAGIVRVVKKAFSRSRVSLSSGIRCTLDSSKRKPLLTTRQDIQRLAARSFFDVSTAFSTSNSCWFLKPRLAPPFTSSEVDRASSLEHASSSGGHSNLSAWFTFVASW